MNIITPQVTAYLDALYHPQEGMQELRRQAEADHVPIILRDTERFLYSLLRLKKPQRILEIGTAVGYSAIFFAKVCQGASVTTLELSADMACTAARNIEAFGLSQRISIRQGDARETLLAMQQENAETYDFIFIDAAKGQYQVFWDASRPLWSKDALIVSDNVLFKGMTASDDFVSDRRNKTIIRRMREYLHTITELSDVDTSVLAVGDGIALSLAKYE